MKIYVLEHHPNDSRIKIADDGIVQTLSSRMGTGGGNVPLIMFKEDRYGEYRECQQANSIRAKSATCGGGSEVLIVDNGRCDENMVCWKRAAGSGKAVGQSGSAELYARSAGDPEREREREVMR